MRGYWFVGHGGYRRVGVVEIVGSIGVFPEEFPGAMAKEFVDADLDFKSCVAIFGVESEVGWVDEGNGLVRFFGTEDVAK